MATTGFKIEPRSTNAPATHGARAGGRKAPARGDFFAELSHARKDVPSTPTDATKPAARVDRGSQGRVDDKATEKPESRVRDRDDAVEAAAEDAALAPVGDEQPLEPVADGEGEGDTTEAHDDAAPDGQADDADATEPDPTLAQQLAAATQGTATQAEAATPQADDDLPPSAAPAATVPIGKIAGVVGELLPGAEAVDANGVPLESPEGLEMGVEAVAKLTPDQPRLSQQNARPRGTAGDAELVAQAPTTGDPAADPTAPLATDPSPTATLADPTDTLDSAIAKPLAPDAAALLASTSPTPRAANVDLRAAVAAPQMAPEAQFAQANHDKIVTGVSGQMLTNGGTMQIRLDPPHLGPLAVSVHMRDGVVTASFETQNDDATKLLSHSLSQLKSALEAQGLSVDKLQVQQAPKNQEAGKDSPDGRQQDQQGLRDQPSEQQQQKQRQELLRRMWQRVNGDPLDLVG
jgi:flagellar hook-length control protein FliK